ncbi:MAG: SUMF1/EgtB/PvdO family nonheme iron enzyme, partial [Acidobacteria bacterium]|nr:SUMF1/EgtB/PvdO family nonheme iron enzyme [Acidobacteriota bacterium]
MIRKALVSSTLLLLAASAGATTQPGAAKGWHGEALPAGMEKSPREGEYIWKKDGSLMVYVPAGTFPRGSHKGQKDETPVREIYLDAFYIDKYEVSWGQWKASGLPYRETDLEEPQKSPGPPDWGIVDDQPVVNVTWHNAQEYLTWAGKQLPTEAQWEKAARGTDGRTYPWGEEPPNFDRAVWREHPTAEASTAKIDCCAAGASPYGVFNMAGNVYEWCEDTYDGKYYATSPDRNPVNRGKGRYKVLRGGAHVLEIEDLRSALRYRLWP